MSLINELEDVLFWERGRLEHLQENSKYADGLSWSQDQAKIRKAENNVYFLTQTLHLLRSDYGYVES